MQNSLIEVLKVLFTRDLNKLKDEVSAYQREANLWIINKEILNSGGNLCLHLIGNLNAFIAAVYGKNGYVRQRELEFSQKDVPRDELLAMIDKTIKDVNHGLDQISEEDLKGEYPARVFDQKTTTEHFLVHLVAHLSYHLGQVNYHRRLLDN